MRPIQTLIVLTLMTVVACAPSGTRSNEQAQSDTAAAPHQSMTQLVGIWELASEPPQPMPGFRIAFTVDSVKQSRYFGRLTHYFAGNVGGNLEVFQPFAGSVEPRGRVEFRVDRNDPTELGIVAAGLLRADTIHVDTLIIGPDTLPQRDRRWFLTKR
jgi:hypothetical protein